jgi:coenzyme PQQ precursor peptide PqqA
LDLIERNWHDHPAEAQWRRLSMAWRTPKLVEIACGCEINAYFPADF